MIEFGAWLVFFWASLPWTRDNPMSIAQWFVANALVAILPAEGVEIMMVALSSP